MAKNIMLNSVGVSTQPCLTPFVIGNGSVHPKCVYPSELQLFKANSSDTEAPFLDLHLTISDGFISSKMYDKRDDFDFDIVNFPFLDGDIPHATTLTLEIKF